MPYFRFDQLKSHHLNPHLSTTQGPVIEAATMYFRCVTKKSGEQSRLHYHPNEFMAFLLDGEFESTVGDEQQQVTPGTLVHIPSNAQHSFKAGPQGIRYLYLKDRTWTLIGAAADEALPGKARSATEVARDIAAGKYPGRDKAPQQSQAITSGLGGCHYAMCDGFDRAAPSGHHEQWVNGLNLSWAYVRSPDGHVCAESAALHELLVAKSASDGYTLLVGSPGLAVSPALYTRLGYDALKDLTPVGQVSATPHMLVVNPALPVKTLRDFINLARGKPGEISYFSAGAGGSDHLGTELFSAMAGLKMVHVPYKGVGAAFPDLIAGRTHLTISSTASLGGLFRSKYLRPLAVTTAQRTPMLPEVPTMGEAGVPGFVVTQWHGLLAPARTPKAIVERVQQGVAAILKNPDVLGRLAADGTDPVGSTPAQFAAHMKAERSKWIRAIKDAGITIQ